MRCEYLGQRRTWNAWRMQYESLESMWMDEFLLPLVEGWAEWGQMFTDSPLWHPVVKRIWGMNPALGEVTGIHVPNRIEAGYPGTCAVFVVDRAVVLKFFPPMVARDFEREQTVYSLISGSLPHLPTIVSEGVYRDRIDWPYLVMTCLPGEAWRDVHSRIDTADQMTILTELGRVVRAGHDTPLPVSGTWPSLSAWENLLQQRKSRIVAELRGRTSLTGPVIEEIETLVETANWFAAAPRLLHADLTEDHVLVAQAEGGWRMSGLLDWADAEVGDPYYEYVTLWFSICHQKADRFNAFLHGYGMSGGFRELDVRRLLAFTFLHRFGTGILGDLMRPEEQRAVPNLLELEKALFPDILED